jgi:hypothetical protein
MYRAFSFTKDVFSHALLSEFFVLHATVEADLLSLRSIRTAFIFCAAQFTDLVFLMCDKS